jgi:hypothetical protein
LSPRKRVPRAPQPALHPFLKQEDLARPVHRVFRLCWFRKWLATGHLTLRIPLLWDDPLENAMLRLPAVREKDGAAVSLHDVFGRFYGDCWTLDKRDRDAFWRIYAPNKDGVRLRRRSPS